MGISSGPYNSLPKPTHEFRRSGVKDGVEKGLHDVLECLCDKMTFGQLQPWKTPLLALYSRSIRRHYRGGKSMVQAVSLVRPHHHSNSGDSRGGRVDGGITRHTDTLQSGPGDQAPLSTKHG